MEAVKKNFLQTQLISYKRTLMPVLAFGQNEFDNPTKFINVKKLSQPLNFGTSHRCYNATHSYMMCQKSSKSCKRSLWMHPHMKKAMLDQTSVLAYSLLLR